QRRQFLRPGEPADAGGEIRVRRAPREDLAEQRHDAVEPQAIERGEQTARPRDLQDSEPSTLTEDAPQLAQRPVQVLDVPHAEADGRGIEAPDLERKLEQIPADPLELG